MIRIQNYSDTVEENYCNKVNSILKSNKSFVLADFVDSCKSFMPDKYSSMNEEEFLKKLIKLKYREMREILKYINHDKQIRNIYIEKVFQFRYKDDKDKYKYRELDSKEIELLVDLVFEGKKIDKIETGFSARNYQHKEIFKSCINVYDEFSKNKVNKFIQNESKIKVCPYCNRDYINSREDQSSAQMDHFYSKNYFPFLAISLYNLIPTCATCNRIKSDKIEWKFVSPFDDEYLFDDELRFEYDINKKKIKFVTQNNYKDRCLRVNIERLKLEEAYVIHDSLIEEYVDKKSTYVDSLIDEIGKSLLEWGISNPIPGKSYDKNQFIEHLYGKKIEPEEYIHTSLGKLKHDILKSIGVYD